MMRTLGRTTFLAMVLGLAVALGAPAAGAGSLEDEGMVVAVDAGRGLVTVDDTQYVVDARTRIEDLDGRPIPLAKVPTRDAPPYSMNQATPGAVSYHATGNRQGWRLLRLTLIEGEIQ
jgi:hypothetical protein